jgi:hypothetical protein
MAVIDASIYIALVNARERDQLECQERTIAAIASIPLIGYDRLRTPSSYATVEITKEQVAQSGNFSGIKA